MVSAARALASSALATGVHAQTPAAQSTPAPTPPVQASDGAASTEDGFVYDAGFYAKFAPQTALEIVERTPGFVLDEGADRRGLAGTGGNVLIDGRQPSMKSLSLREALARIPAAQVASVRLMRGAAAGALTAGGQGAVADVRLARAQGAGTWTLTAESQGQARVSPRGGATWSGGWRRFDVNAAAERYGDYRPVRGAREFADAQGRPVGTLREADPRTYRQVTASGEVERSLAGGRAKLNGRATRWTFKTGPVAAGFDAAGTPTGVSDLSTRDREETHEAGTDWKRAFGPWTVESIVLAQRTRYAGDSAQIDRNAAGHRNAQLSSRFRTRAGEYIVRGSAARRTERRNLEWGGEVALNTLSSRLAIISDAGAGPLPVMVPAANVDVAEWRGEVFANIVRPLAPAWSLDARLAAEASRLTVSGDAENQTALVFLKPSLQVSRRVRKRDQLRLSVARVVEQLDFNDFAGAADFEDDRIEAGNPELLPETAWRVEASYDWRVGASGAVSLILFRAWIDNAADRIPVGAAFDAPGNIGDGHLKGVTVEADAPLDRLAPGLRATANLTLQAAEVSDPLTGQRRTRSNFQETAVRFGLRQDLPRLKLAWGIDYSDRSEAVYFRRAQIERYDESAFVVAFVERTLGAVKARLSVENLADQDLTTARTAFAPDRLGRPAGFERRTLRYGPYWVLQLKGAF